MYIKDADQNVHELYGQDIMDYLDSCYYMGVLTISGAKPIGRYEMWDGDIRNGSVFIIYDPVEQKNVDNFIFIEEDVTSTT